MVPVRNTNSMRNPLQSVLTPRIVPKIRRESSSGAAAARTTAATGSSSNPAGVTDAAPSDPAANFKALFGRSASTYTTTPSSSATPKAANPTLQSMFGSSPYVANPGGVAPNGVAYSYNPVYFATRAAAEKLAQRYGGTVVEANAITPYGPFQQNQMNEMIRFSNGNVVNAGILASYYDRGWTQEQIDTAVAGEIASIPG